VNILAKQFPASLPPSSSSTSPFNLLKGNEVLEINFFLKSILIFVFLDDFDQEGNSEDTIESPALLNPLSMFNYYHNRFNYLGIVLNLYSCIRSSGTFT